MRHRLDIDIIVLNTDIKIPTVFFMCECDINLVCLYCRKMRQKTCSFSVQRFSVLFLNCKHSNEFIVFLFYAAQYYNVLLFELLKIDSAKSIVFANYLMCVHPIAQCCLFFTGNISSQQKVCSKVIQRRVMLRKSFSF